MTLMQRAMIVIISKAKSLGISFSFISFVTKQKWIIAVDLLHRTIL